MIWFLVALAWTSSAVPLLGRFQQGHLVQAGQVRGQVLGRLGRTGLLLGLGHRAQDDLVGVFVVELFVVDVVDLERQQVPGPHFVDDAVDAAAGPLVPLGQFGNRHAPQETAVDDILGDLVERVGQAGEDGVFRVRLVVAADRVADRLDGPAGLLGDAFGDVVEAAIAG